MKKQDEQLWEHLKRLTEIFVETAKEVEKEKNAMEERIVDEAYDTGFKNGRAYERELIKCYLVEKQ